jgi:hypothetical protein
MNAVLGCDAMRNQQNAKLNKCPMSEKTLGMID